MSSVPEARHAEPAVPIAQVEPEFATAIAALEQALAHQDDAEARRILDRLWLREPTGHALELARSFDRVLRGRECLRAVKLDLVIASQPVRDRPHAADLAVSLHATSDLSLVLKPGPATLRITTVAVGVAGVEDRRVESRACGSLGELSLDSEHAMDIGLWQGDLELPRGALAVRRTFELALLAGVLTIGAEELPAQDPRVAPAETCVLAGLTAERVTVEDFVAYAALGGVDSRGALERAVAIEPLDRERALDALWPLVNRIPRSSVVALVPALRWLSAVATPGGDPDAWRAWLAQRNERRERAKPRPALALPKVRSEP